MQAVQINMIEWNSLLLGDAQFLLVMQAVLIDKVPNTNFAHCYKQILNTKFFALPKRTSGICWGGSGIF